MNALINHYIESNEIKKLANDIHKGNDQQLISGLSGGAKPIFYQALHQSLEKPVLIVSPNLYRAQQTFENLLKIVGEEKVHLYPAEELIAAEFSMSSHELRSQRIETLDHLARKRKGIYVVPIAGLRRILPSKAQWLESSLEARVDDTMDISSWITKLMEMGYTRQNMVTAPGEFALRGGILDVYPPHFENPVRIELFDTDVDSIRTFSADDQRSIEKLQFVSILPASEFIFPQEQLNVIAEKLEEQLAVSIKKVKNDDVKQLLAMHIQHDIDLMREGTAPENIIKYASFSSHPCTSIVTYFPEDGLILFDEIGRIMEVIESLEKEEKEWMFSLIEDGKNVHASKISFTFHEINQMMLQKKLYLSLFIRSIPGITIKQSMTMSCKPMQQFHGQMDLLKSEIERWQNNDYTVYLLVDGEKRMDKVQAILKDYKMQASLLTDDVPPASPAVYILKGQLSDGFELPSQKIAVITDAELFKGRQRRQARTQKISNAERIKNYSEIKPGDYVVHVDHGIGKYIGIINMAQGGVERDYLEIHFREGDKLYVPTDKIDLIQKYVGSGEQEPSLHKLGGTAWRRTKSRVTAAVQDIADDLIKLYAQRESEKGFAFSSDDEMQRTFEQAFPYVETEDQLRSIQEIKRDMEGIRPMDRLLCGDVGYGKTEVAIRAAFKAVNDNKQVAFLVPTTILAQQHYETMKERFEGFPVEVALLNRFKTKKEQAETIKRLKEGRIDVVVGTHRLLSNDVEYLDLGLLVVDEEQRFGVTHKERLKQIKTNVDVLTLTATPIPRTLHMSMLGVRDLSVIETPPADRYPVQTYVMEHNFALIREAIEREMSRGGQVFYLYNRVEDMTKRVDEIKQLVPDVRIAHAHGQMSESMLESTILSFLEGEFDVLVTTTIIETGIDIPNVNTLIVHDADRMGLSQLYQLRGRVGRSNRIAYGYFLYERDKILTEVAENRLQAIKEFTELGSGFKIAMRDLSIRGAGNLLGSQQHGFIDSVGFDLYSQLLQEAIEERKTGVAKEKVLDVEISLPLNAYIPDTYIQDGFQKIQMYKRIKAIGSEENYSELIDEMIDRFGDMPYEAELLLRIARLKVWGRTAKIESIKQNKKKVEVLFTQEGTMQIDGAKLLNDSMKLGRAIGFSMEGNQLLLTVDERYVGNKKVFDILESLMALLPDALKEKEISV